MTKDYSDLSMDIPRRIFDDGYIHLFMPNDKTVIRATWSPMLQ